MRLAAESRQLEAAPGDLAERRHVRADVVVFLGAAVREAEAREDLVEDQHDPPLPRELPQPPQVIALRDDHAGSAQDRFDDQGRDLVVVLLEHRGGPLDVVVRVDDHGVRHGLRDAAAVGHGLVAVHPPRGPAVHVDALQDVIVGAVVRALGLRDLLAARVGARRAQGVHRRLRAAVREPHLLHRRHGALDRLEVVDEQFARDAEHRAGLELFDHLERDVPVVVAEEQSAEPHHEVEDLVAVDVVDVAAVAVVREEGVRLEEADVALDAPRGQAAGAAPELGASLVSRQILPTELLGRQLITSK